MKVIVENIARHSKETSITVDAGEVVYYVAYGFGAVQKKVTLDFVGEGGEGYILGILIGETGDCTLSTTQLHEKPNTTSDLLVKTILRGDAKFHYDGVIKIN